MWLFVNESSVIVDVNWSAVMQAQATSSTFPFDSKKVEASYDLANEHV